ncbi:MAG: histidine--tRNA ligase [Candidatus Micrarchaeota archaeon]
MAQITSPRGTRDFLQGEALLRARVVRKIEEVYKRFGYDPAETPAFEELAVLERKCGEDVQKLIYKLEGDKLGLRFDLTVPTARVVAGTALPKPFKRYCIGEVWRREEPQKGRFREFLQADIDIFGSAGMACEAELLACASECLRELGFGDFKILLNNRKTLDAVVKSAGVPEGKASAVFRAVDKLGKMSEREVREEMRGKGISEGAIEKIFGMTRVGWGNEQKLAMIKKFDEEGGRELEEIMRLARAYGVDNIEIDLTLARGLDYYTGPIFEISAGGGVGSVAGGGRFDNLVELYGGSPTPAVGISFGVERIIEVMRGALKEMKKTETRVYVAPVKEEFYLNAIGVAREFRKAGVSAQIDLMSRNLKKQLEYANALGIPFVAIIGEKEAKEGKITLRNFKSGEEKLLSIDEAVKMVCAC